MEETLKCLLGNPELQQVIDKYVSCAVLHERKLNSQPDYRLVLLSSVDLYYQFVTYDVESYMKFITFV